jgi:hypothetical protein
MKGYKSGSNLCIQKTYMYYHFLIYLIFEEQCQPFYNSGIFYLVIDRFQFLTLL